jgi:4-hydroxy-tetrahydrodipicolinate reductase
MKFALYGHGRMGKAIEQVAGSRGHEVVLKVGSANAGAVPSGMDVAIEFSRPDHAVKNMELCLTHGVPVVGTTGWYDRLAEVRQMVQRHQGSLLWASNFSIGVNLFFRVNRLLASLMDKQPGYQVHIDEIHHVHKLDAPSGTAITLAKDIDLRHHRYAGWELKEPGKEQRRGTIATGAPAAPVSAKVPIQSERTGKIPGKHSVTWTSAEDRVIITHDAFGRTGFATGAVIAAEWLRGRTGLFTLDDMLGQ